MKWYWAVACSNTVEDPFVADIGSLGGFEEWSFICARRIENWPASAWVKSSASGNDGGPDDVLQTYLGLPVFSRRLQEALLAEGIDEIQYLPLVVRQSDDEPLPGFAIANILSCMPALVAKESKLSRYRDDWVIEDRRGQISGILRATLRQQALKAHDIIRLEEFSPPVYVLDRFKSVFESGAFTGYEFVEVRTV